MVSSKSFEFRRVYKRLAVFINENVDGFTFALAILNVALVVKFLLQNAKNLKMELMSKEEEDEDDLLNEKSKKGLIRTKGNKFPLYLSFSRRRKKHWHWKKYVLKLKLCCYK